MRLSPVPMFAALAFLFCSWNVWAQNKVDREVQIHTNVKLIVMAAADDIPEEIATQYRNFIPILQDALKEATEDQTDECALTIRASIGIKEVGAKKVQRPQASVSAFRRNSRQEFVGNLILYSYVNSGPVNKEETMQFLTKQILEPAVCRKAE